MKPIFASRAARAAAIALIVALAAILRVPAWRQLPYDIDERVYLPLAQRYAAALEDGRLAALGDPLDNPEHPALAKLLFAAALALPAGPAAQGAPGFEDTSGAQPPGLLAARLVSLLASLLLAALLAWRNPLAGLVFALSSWQIKYGVVAYLEAVPGLFATGAVLLVERWWRLARDPGQPAAPPWLLLAASGLLGAAAAAKYPYAIIAGPVIALCAAWRWRQRWGGWRGALLVTGASMVAFVALNPFMWGNPLAAIRDTVAFHMAYSGNDLVSGHDFQPWDTLRLLFKPMPYDQFFPFSLFNQLRIEGLLTILGLLGLPWLWRAAPPLAIWLAASVLFVLGWPTKWAHYTLLVIPPLSLGAGALLAAAAAWAGRRMKL